MARPRTRPHPGGPARRRHPVLRRAAQGPGLARPALPPGRGVVAARPVAAGCCRVGTRRRARSFVRGAAARDLRGIDAAGRLRDRDARGLGGRARRADDARSRTTLLVARAPAPVTRMRSRRCRRRPSRRCRPTCPPSRARASRCRTRSPKRLHAGRRRCAAPRVRRGAGSNPTLSEAARGGVWRAGCDALGAERPAHVARAHAQVRRCGSRGSCLQWSRARVRTCARRPHARARRHPAREPVALDSQRLRRARRRATGSTHAPWTRRSSNSRRSPASRRPRSSQRATATCSSTPRGSPVPSRACCSQSPRARCGRSIRGRRCIASRPSSACSASTAGPGRCPARCAGAPCRRRYARRGCARAIVGRRGAPPPARRSRRRRGGYAQVLERQPEASRRRCSSRESWPRHAAPCRSREGRPLPRRSRRCLRSPRRASPLTWPSPTATPRSRSRSCTKALRGCLTTRRSFACWGAFTCAGTTASRPRPRSPTS